MILYVPLNSRSSLSKILHKESRIEEIGRGGEGRERVAGANVINVREGWSSSAQRALSRATSTL